jgi:hypothetical protein
VRLQWDPDHGPGGAPQARRAIQLGLRRAALEAYGKREALEIRDVSAFVADQREHRGDKAALLLPVHQVYRPADPAVAARIGLDP